MICTRCPIPQVSITGYSAPVKLPKKNMIDTPPVTQRDVASACGVHPSTICLALKNSPSIPLATRVRVQAAAADLGYRPNAAARNLALLRSDKQGGGSLPIAWINQEPQRNHWRSDPEARVVFEHAQRRATELGYHLEEIWTREPGMTPGRLVKIAQARGIEGVVLPVHRSLELTLLNPAWNDFAIVGMNDHRLAEWVDTVCPDHYRNADTVFRELGNLDLGRVGLALTARFDAACSGLVHSCYLRHQCETPRTQRIPVCFLADGGQTEHAVFESWFQMHRPEVVVTGDASLASHGRSLGLGAMWVGLGASFFPFDAGVDDAAGAVAVAAIDCVADKMRRFEKGARESTRVHLLKSSWVEPRKLQLALERETVVA